MKRIVCIIMLLAVTALGACGEKPQTSYRHQETIVLNAGDTYEFQMGAVPEGYDRSGYAWESTGDCITIDENGIATAVKGGYTNVTAKLDTDKTEYIEFYSLRVSAQAGEFTMNSTSLTLKNGEGATLEVSTDAVFSFGEYFWLKSYQSVVFYDDGITKRYYGSGEVRIPESLGIREMQFIEFINPIGRFVVPDGVEVAYSAYWNSSTFVVKADSPAEEYCMEHDVAYEYGP